MSKINLSLFVIFSLENVLLSKSSHIPFDRAWLALQNCICDISLQPRNSIKKVKIQKFSAYKIFTVFQYFAKKNFISVCSPFDSASNHVLDIFSKCTRAEIIRIEKCSLTLFLPIFHENRYDICIFSPEIFSLFNFSHTPFDRSWLALQNCIDAISFWTQYRVELTQIPYFWHAMKCEPSSISTKRPYHMTIVRQITPPSYSPYNSASNDIMDINFISFKVDVIKLRREVLTSYATIIYYTGYYIFHVFRGFSISH